MELKSDNNPLGQFAHFPTIKANVKQMVENDEVVVFETQKDKKPVGVISARFERPWFVNGTCLCESFILCIDPKFYGFGRVATNWMKKAARSGGADFIYSSSDISKNSKMIENLAVKYSHGTPVGKTFIYPIN